jgi:hypothetical protein
MRTRDNKISMMAECHGPNFAMMPFKLLYILKLVPKMNGGTEIE